MKHYTKTKLTEYILDNPQASRAEILTKTLIKLDKNYKVELQAKLMQYVEFVKFIKRSQGQKQKNILKK